MEDFLAYDEIQKKLRKFFSSNKRFIEVPAQTKRSILSACEDPNTVSTFEFRGEDWPLPQTGQMILEEILLKNPEIERVFCSTTSYRNEPNPIPGRHDLIFPMFEFEGKGGIHNLEKLEEELLEYLGFAAPKKIFYEEACKNYGVDFIAAEQEDKLCKDYNGPVMLHTFPRRTHPFWNMEHNGRDLYNKIDVLLKGIETIGSAERSCNVEEMREDFMTISNGQYRQKLFDLFGEKRVMQELDSYFSLKMFPRFGGGIGITRLCRAMQRKD